MFVVISAVLGLVCCDYFTVTRCCTPIAENSVEISIVVVNPIKICDFHRLHFDWSNVMQYGPLQTV
jgi:hypothetical protein